MLPAQQHSLRFFGNGSGQIDRVKVPIDAPHRPADVGGNFTVEFWIKGLAAENSGIVTAQADGDGWITGNVLIDRDIFGGGDHGDWGIAIGGNGRVGFGLDGTGGGRTIVTTSGNVLDAAWHHIAVTRSGTTGEMAIYVDGVRLATGTGPQGDISYRDGRATQWPQSDPFIVFGAEKHDAAEFYGGSYPSFSGWLDEVRISNAIRYTGSAFTRPAAPFTADSQTLGLWKFDEGSGTTVADTSGAQGGPSNGTLEFGGTPPVAGPLWSTDSPFAASVLVDFGHTDFPTASPDASGRHWNNLATNASTAPVGSLPDLINLTGLPTGIGLSVAAFGAGANANGTTTPDATTLGPLGIDSATRDGFFIAPGNTAGVTLTGLAPNSLYRLTLFGSRDAAETRVTEFSAQGFGAPVAATVQTSGAGIGLAPEANANRAFTAVLENVRPTADGRVVLAVSVRSGSFGYLGAGRIERTGTAANSPPSAVAVAWEGAPRAGAALQGRYEFSDPDGDAQSGTTFQWERSATGSGNGTAIPDAQGATYTPGPSDAGHFLRLVVTPGAAAGVTPGNPAASPWQGPVGVAEALTVFHVGNSFTRWGDVPAQIASFAASRAQPHVWGRQIRDGEGLGYHWANGLPGGSLTAGTPSRTELATATWQTLVLQPMSREWLPENQPALLANADLFDNLADAGGARLLLYAYWPYLSESVDTQDAINAAFENLRIQLSSDGPPVRVIPVGEAFRRVVREIDAGSLTGLTRADLYQDDLHPGDLGYYLSALVHYATLYQQSPVGLPATAISADPDSSEPVSINPSLAAEFQRIAWEVARSASGSGITSGRFDSWAAANLPAGLREPEDIPQADGLRNLVRWAFGIPAGGDGTGRLPAVTAASDNEITITYQIGADAEDAGLLLVEEWSGNLATWDSPPPAGLQRTRNGQEITLRFPATGERLFFRCRARMP